MKLWRTPFDHDPTAEPLGQVYIDKERCKGCGYCIEYCQRDVLTIGSELSSKGYQLAAVKDGARCLACGFCEFICPEFALKLVVRTSPAMDNKG
jgi:2-oxoglutarate ferredoxin oxidoreductase subunit delta